MRAALLVVSLLACRPVADAAAPVTRSPIALTYLGVAGWQLDAGETTILVDPYFSRPADLEGSLTPDDKAIAARAPKRADLVMVGHSHVDHVLDVPAVALRTGAQVMGSASTARVARAAGLPEDRIVPIKGAVAYVEEERSVAKA